MTRAVKIPTITSAPSGDAYPSGGFGAGLFAGSPRRAFCFTTVTGGVFAGGLLCNFLLMSGGTLIWATGKVSCNGDQYCNKQKRSVHGDKIVTWPTRKHWNRRRGRKGNHDQDRHRRPWPGSADVTGIETPGIFNRDRHQPHHAGDSARGARRA